MAMPKRTGSARTVALAHPLCLLAALALATAATYVNLPIVDPTKSDELSDAGNAYPHIQNTETVYLPRANGWCKNNVGCPTNINDDDEQCYSIFYPELTDPVAFNYSQINSADANFNSYTMTYRARLYLMDFAQNGALALAETGESECTTRLQDAAFVSMWVNNIRDGFSCPNNDGLPFKSSAFMPPCQSMCYGLMESPCPYQTAFLTGAETVRQYCELLPTQNCFSAAALLQPLASLVVLTALVSVINALLL